MFININGMINTGVKWIGGIRSTGGVIPPPAGNLFDGGILQANGVLQTDTILGLP